MPLEHRRMGHPGARRIISDDPTFAATVCGDQRLAIPLAHRGRLELEAAARWRINSADAARTFCGCREPPWIRAISFYARALITAPVSRRTVTRDHEAGRIIANAIFRLLPWLGCKTSDAPDTRDRAVRTFVHQEPA